MNNTEPTQNQTKTVTPSEYENNPLYVSTNGIDLLFKKAQSVGIVLAVIAALSLIGGGVPSPFTMPNQAPTEAPAATSTGPNPDRFLNDISNVPVEMWLFIGLLVLVALVIFSLIMTLLQGITDVTSAHLARGKKIGITDALKEVVSNFWGYLWVLIVMNVKIFLWTLLFIIPGIIMAIRYSLSGVVFFDKKLKGNASVKESSRLVKGGWLTTFGSQYLLNMLTLGFISPILMPGTNAVLYSQFAETKEAKPKAHIVSWLTLIVPLFLVILFVSILGYGIANYARFM